MLNLVVAQSIDLRLKRTMKYTCIGLSEADRSLVQKQFGVLKNKLANDWVFSSTASHYDLILLKGRELPKSVSGTMVAVIDAPIRNENEIPLEWPVRIFDLLELITRVEASGKRKNAKYTQASSFSFANMVKEYLSENTQPLIVALNADDYICIDPSREKVLMTHTKTLDALKSVLALEEAQVKTLSSDHLNQISWKIAKPLKSFIWSLALRENALDIYGWDINRYSFQIKRFPSLGEWESSPFMLRLASLYTRRDCTIQLAMNFCKIEANEVATFLHACNMIDAGLITKSVQPRPVSQAAATNAENAAKYNSLFGQVRSKLGTVFGNMING